MPAPTVYDKVADNVDLHGQLFAGKKFFVAQRVPFRNTYLNMIRNNGGELVLLEKKADYLIFDHIRHDCPPGSISYTFIEKSIEEGELQDPEKHRIGPPAGTAREAGALAQPTKSGRAAYTAEEDRILYKWVRDAERQGKLASGNQIYKELEAKYPRHTWQSWRDRYLKQLRDRPPSAFDRPEDAELAPPPNVSSKRMPTSNPEKGMTSQNGGSPPSGKERASDTSAGPELTGAAFAMLFDEEDWEELYAFVEEITSCPHDRYATCWEAWAAEKAQTADQWRQYFEKVVKPQWDRDPISRRERIKRKVEMRHEAESSQNKGKEPQPRDETRPSEAPVSKPSPSPEPKKSIAKRKRSDVHELFEADLKERYRGKASAAYIHYAREQRWSVLNDHPGFDYAELHALLESRWDALSGEERAPYFTFEVSENTIAANVIRSSPQVRLSSSTVIHETPKYITEAYEKARQQIREGILDNGYEEEPVKKKRQKSEGAVPMPAKVADRETLPGTQKQPIELSSEESSRSDSYPHQGKELEDFQDRQQTPQAVRSIIEAPGSELDIGGLDALSPPQGLEPLNSSDYPSNTPTPRAPRYKTTAFDTQAILSSPSQSLSLSALPRPGRCTQITAEQEQSPENSRSRSSSPAEEPPSEGSTTHSLEEFRHSLKEDDYGPKPLAPLLHSKQSSPESSLPEPSSPTSSDSGDPDPPLGESEFEEFFKEQRAEGFPDETISAALIRTGVRPLLAIEVLAAIQQGKPLPNRRGIWTTEDDEDVENGDGVALARLERKHTLDGWGGITERSRFLEHYRNRKQRST